MTDMVLLGDEAVALGAIHAGLSAAYAYPGTPSTEITEYLIRHYQKHGKPYASWSANEKTAYEESLGVSMVGKRTLVSMKHVGLNVAADPFMNSAIVSINGGLVVAVADDPGMHSSQNEQDSRYFADFAKIPCLEPADQQEAYEMTREAFDLSERFKLPVMIRLVTRLAHSRAVVRVRDPKPENSLQKPSAPASWILLPSNARKQYRALLDRQAEILAYTEASSYNPLTLNKSNTSLGVITTGLGRNYFLENLEEMENRPSHLHIGAYPIPVDKIRALADHVDILLFLEEGYPYVERLVRGILPPTMEIRGKLSGHVPPDGELNPDIVRCTLDLPARTGISSPSVQLANRPPQLCQGCPHADTYGVIKEVLAAFDPSLVTSDIGCYTLGALPPYNAIESCVCMGASVSMAVGAAAAGFYPVIAVIGDSTFLHSGVTPLMDAASANSDMTLIILDNETVGMTGGQPTVLPSSRLETIVKGVGVDPDHLQIIEAHRKYAEKNTEILRREVSHHGLSVIIAVRECLETAKRSKKG
ncbi:MAG TPA: thiamine pyrophosphate-dependent enzyme [Thermoanaerobaculia bacterium]|nr:thiamine pyrophosphate-dependent enzyme [Thermoanaerobaculia bacterium]HUM29192.1 thiamine pyrophosphate-dependent enzyme [Thermoanaerobaculia bacterium]HXK67571.1 thiamine pyrophosphate-dependent enzyme [Thermoanaerobaculia bacterium]